MYIYYILAMRLLNFCINNNSVSPDPLDQWSLSEWNHHRVNLTWLAIQSHVDQISLEGSNFLLTVTFEENDSHLLTPNLDPWSHPYNVRADQAHGTTPIAVFDYLNLLNNMWSMCEAPRLLHNLIPVWTLSVKYTNVHTSSTQMSQFRKSESLLNESKHCHDIRHSESRQQHLTNTASVCSVSQERVRGGKIRRLRDDWGQMKGCRDDGRVKREGK